MSRLPSCAAVQAGGGEVSLAEKNPRWDLGFSTKLIFISSFCKKSLDTLYKIYPTLLSHIFYLVTT